MPIRTDTDQTPARTAEIYQAAANLMVTKGFGGTSIADIAKAVGMTKAGLYHHIASKEDMLYQIMSHAMSIMQAAVVEPAQQVADPLARLELMIKNHITIILEGGQTFTVLISEIHHLTEEHQAVIGQSIASYRAIVMDSMDELAKAGKLRPGLDTDIASRHMLRTIAGIAQWFHYDFEGNLELIISQTTDYTLAAILA